MNGFMLQHFDTELLLFLNGFHTPFLDHFMWNYSQSLTWIPFYLALAVLVICRWRKKAFWILLILGLCVGLSDFISSSIIKTLVERPRPSRVPELEGVLHLVNGYCGGRFGFVSSHAANSFGLAMSFCLMTGRKELPTCMLLFVWAFLNAYSRIYLGVHYPGDILGGVLVGIAVAVCAWAFVRRRFPMLLARENQHITPAYVAYAPCAIWLVTVICIMFVF